jgi:uncharacterized protein (DUF305 family)
MYRRIALYAGAGALILTVAACGGGGSSSSGHADMPMPTTSTSAAADHSAEDVMFAQMMVPHHAQAIQMAELAATRAQSNDVKELASKIKSAQAPEIATMSGWLRIWGQSVPTASSSTSDNSESSMDMGSGMMSSADMTQLEGLSGNAFDRAFLTMMIQHHQGAIAMAKSEQRSGRYEPAQQLAAKVIAAQSAEINEMRHLLTLS